MIPIASFEDDKLINVKMGARSLVAEAMMCVRSIAAYYENGDYWFIIQNVSRPLSAKWLADFYKFRPDIPMEKRFAAIDAIAKSFQASNFPPAPPIIDPIYFGT